MTFTYWMYNCLLLLSSINMHNDLFLFRSHLPSACRLSAWWPRRWCRDTRSSSLKGVSQKQPQCSDRSSVCVFVCGQWLSASKTRGSSCPPGILYFTVTHKRMTTVLFCPCSWKYLRNACLLSIFSLLHLTGDDYWFSFITPVAQHSTYSELNVKNLTFDKLVVHSNRK